MTWYKFSWMVLLCWVLSLLFFEAQGNGSGISVNFLESPALTSRLNSGTFKFNVSVDGKEVSLGENGNCGCSNITCKLDNGITTDCGAKKFSFTGLKDGNHTFKVCSVGSPGHPCSSYEWIVDTVAPTGYITSPSSFTNAWNVSVNISFTEPCTGEDGKEAFKCSVSACNLVVSGDGQVIPSSLVTLVPKRKYSLLVNLSSKVELGNVRLEMENNICSDTAGNNFTWPENSSFNITFDRKTALVNLSSPVPEKLLLLENVTRTVRATNNIEELKVYLNFSQLVLNSSAEVLNSLHTSKGALLPINGENLGNGGYSFKVVNVSSFAIITIGFDSKSIITRYGNPVTSIEPVTFLYDTQRPEERLITTSRRTRQQTIPIWIDFLKPVLGFNKSSISILGGHLLRFNETTRRLYHIEVLANEDDVSVIVPENVIGDVAGNKNEASEVLKVRHYSVPIIFDVTSAFITSTFGATSFAAGLLTLSTASLHSTGASSGSSFPLTSDPARNLFRSLGHIQLIALSRWMIALPFEYYEISRDLQWTIPYFNLPGEKGYVQVFQREEQKKENFDEVVMVHKPRTSGTPLPLTPEEYKSFESEAIKADAEYLDSQDLNGWRDFNRSMFWLAVIGGSLILLHASLILILKFRRRNSQIQRGYGYEVLTFPRFEISLLILALPCICNAFTGLVRGGERSGVVVGSLFLGMVCFLLLSFFLFLFVGVTLGKLLQYEEDYQKVQESHWYHYISRAALGPGKRGQWTWKKQVNHVYLTILGPLFKDLRGLPKYMLSQISEGNPQKHGDRIIASDDKIEDASLIQKLFGTLTTYYTLLECVRQVILGTLAGAYTADQSSKSPTIILLSIVAFQLLFLVLLKPFATKRVQLVEIISVACEVGMLTLCLLLLENKFSAGEESKVGICMIILSLIGYLAQLINECYALYRQTKHLDPAKESFLRGLKIAFNLQGNLQPIQPADRNR